MLAKYSYALRRLHRPSEAKRRIDAALMILRNTKDLSGRADSSQRSPRVPLRALGDYKAEARDPARSLATYERLLEKVIASKPDVLNDLRDTPKLSSIYGALSHLYRAPATHPEQTVDVCV